MLRLAGLTDQGEKGFPGPLHGQNAIKVNSAELCGRLLIPSSHCPSDHQVRMLMGVNKFT